MADPIRLRSKELEAVWSALSLRLLVRRAVVLCAAVVLLVCAPRPLWAADVKAPSAGVDGHPTQADAAVPQVPGDDIFGFTTPTDPGNPGDLSYFNENDGRLGKRNGRYGALDSKFALGYTFAENWWIGGAGFSAYNDSRNVDGLDNVQHLKFDGGSVELLHRIIERSAVNPFAVTLDVEPRWGRVDGLTGFESDSYSSAFKLFTDAVVVADRVYWAANLQYDVQRAQDPLLLNHWQYSAQVLVSSAVTYQISPQIFVGAEARFFLQSDKLNLTHEVGRALYVGPTLWLKITDQASFNITYQPQVYGRAASTPNLQLDLDNFERAQFRVKLNVSF
jgi:hypothetical protein